MLKRLFTTFLILSLFLISFAPSFSISPIHAQESESSQSPCIIFTLEDQQGNIYGFLDSRGNIRNETGTQANNYQFSGEQLDPESGLYFLRARYYDPEVGRFISKDPVKGTLTIPQTQNPYVYSLNNPVNLSDPSGETAVGLCSGGSIMVPVQGTCGACGYYVFDTGEFALTTYAGGGGSTGTGGGIQPELHLSSAKNKSELGGQDIYTGGSVRLGPGLEFNYSFSTDDPNIKDVSLGLGVGLEFSTLFPAEIHGGTTKNWILY